MQLRNLWILDPLPESSKKTLLIEEKNPQHFIFVLHIVCSYFLYTQASLCHIILKWLLILIPSYKYHFRPEKLLITIFIESDNFLWDCLSQRGSISWPMEEFYWIMCIPVIIFQPQVVMRQHNRLYSVEKHTAVMHNKKSEKESSKAANLGVTLTLSMLWGHEVQEESWHVDLFFLSLEWPTRT